MASISRRVTVHGDVQGVFFRDSTRRQARAAGVTGWVRNCAGGSVEAHLDGEADAVTGVIEFLKQGPKRARVDHVDVREAAPEDGADFEIR